MSAASQEPDVKVRDVMSSPVVTVRETASVAAAAKLMKEHGVGSVVVVNEAGDPVGLITERDVVRRVVAGDLLASSVKVTEAMSKPLIAVKPETRIVDAAKQMRKSDVRRLAVMDSGRLVGIITSNDIVDVTPELIEIIAEKSKIAPIVLERAAGSLTGYCDRCSGWSEHLKPHDGNYLCPDCLVDLKEGT